MTHPSARTGNPHLVRGVIAGVAGGLLASWVMNLYLAGVSKAQEVLQDPAEKSQQRAPSGEDSTQIVADALPGKRHGGLKQATFHILNRAEHMHHAPAIILAHRREADRAIAHHQ